MEKQINKSLSVAYKILKDGQADLEFTKLWKKVAKEMKYDASDSNLMVEFYSSLLLNKRFVMVGNNVWSLRTNFKFNDIVIEIESVYDDDFESKNDSPEDLLVEERLVPTEELLESPKPIDENEVVAADDLEDGELISANDDLESVSEDLDFEEIIIGK